MAIGEFGKAPGVIAGGAFPLSAPMYWFYEMSQAAVIPARALADATRLMFKNPVNPWSHTTLGKSLAAGAERVSRRQGKGQRGGGKRAGHDLAAHQVLLGGVQMRAPP